MAKLYVGNAASAQAWGDTLADLLYLCNTTVNGKHAHGQVGYFVNGDIWAMFCTNPACKENVWENHIAWQTCQITYYLPKPSYLHNLYAFMVLSIAAMLHKGYINPSLWAKLGFSSN